MDHVKAWRLFAVVGASLFCCQLGIASADAAVPPPAPATPPAAGQGASLAGLPAARPVSDAVLPRGDAMAQVSTAAVSYYEKTYGVSQPVARERLASQLMGQGVQSTLQAKYGNAIAGVSFDNATGHWVVDATSSVPASGVAAVFARTGLSGAYDVSRVGYTEGAVSGAAAELTTRLQSLISRGLVAVTAGGGKVTITLSDTASPADHATVSAAERSIAPSPAAPPITQSSSPGSLVAQATTVKCTGIYCNTLVAGDAYWGSGGSCTMSWYGSLKLSGVTQPLILTAGHCTLDTGGAGAAVYSYDLTSNVQIGNEYLGNFGAGDWGYLYPTNPPPSGLDPGLGRPYGGYFNWGSGTLVRLNYYYSSGVPSSGTVICHNGLGSVDYLGDGTQCGTAAGTTSVNVNNDGTTTTLSGMLQVNSTEECYGDSGGPWDLASSATAVAMQSSASIPKGSNCGTTAWATPVSVAMQAYSPWDITLYGG